MKLSEAIRLGAMNRPHGRGGLISNTGQTCAMGAALDAAGLLEQLTSSIYSNGSNYPDPIAVARFPIMALVVDHPACKLYSKRLPLFTVAATLNDVVGWTREEIADWVERIERAQQIETASSEQIGQAQ